MLAGDRGDQDFGCWDKFAHATSANVHRLFACLIEFRSHHCTPDPLAASDQATFAVRGTRLLRTNTLKWGNRRLSHVAESRSARPSPLPDIRSLTSSLCHFVTDRTVPSVCHIRYPAVESTALARDTKYCTVLYCTVP
jgi:hypothetical protein